MTDISNAKIALLSTNGFEKSELFEPKRQLEAAGADVRLQEHAIEGVRASSNQPGPGRPQGTAPSPEAAILNTPATPAY